MTLLPQANGSGADVVGIGMGNTLHKRRMVVWDPLSI